MTEGLPENLEMWVLAMIKGGFKSKEVLEAERPDDMPPFDDDRTMLENWTTVVHRHGLVLAHLALMPPTRAELMDRMPDAVNRAPAWLDAQVQGEPMTWDLFMQGIAQIMAVHREAIERVVDEQVAEPEEIEEVLAASPVPAATGDEERGELMSGVGAALAAHTKALVDIAYDLERKFGRFTFELDDEGESNY